MVQRVCPGCANSFTSRAHNAIYCSNACRRWVASGHTETRPTDVSCTVCAAPVVGRMATALYCSKRCKSRAVESRRRRDDRARYLKERDRRIAYAIEYARQNPDIGQRAKRKRKALLSQAGIFEVTARDWSRLKARYGNRCAYCAADRHLTMDHIIPVSRGGRHSIGNLIPACGRCNSAKRTRTIMEWRLGLSVPQRLREVTLSHALEAKR